MERKGHAKESNKDLSPKNNSLEEPDVIFRKVFGIVSTIQEDMSLKDQSRKP